MAGRVATLVVAAAALATQSSAGYIEDLPRIVKSVNKDAKFKIYPGNRTAPWFGLDFGDIQELLADGTVVSEHSIDMLTAETSTFSESSYTINNTLATTFEWVVEVDHNYTVCEDYDVGNNGTIDEHAALNVTSLTFTVAGTFFNTSTEVSYGNYTLVVRKGQLLVDISVQNWDFCDTAGRLTVAMGVHTPETNVTALNLTARVPPAKKSVETRQETLMRLAPNGMHLLAKVRNDVIHGDFPSMAMVDGDHGSAVTMSNGANMRTDGARVITFSFPAFEAELDYTMTFGFDLEPLKNSTTTNATNATKTTNTTSGTTSGTTNSTTNGTTNSNTGGTSDSSTATTNLVVSGSAQMSVLGALLAVTVGAALPHLAK